VRATPTIPAATPTASAAAVGKLNVQENPIVSTSKDKPVGFEYWDYFSPGLQERRKAQRLQTQTIQAAAVNKVISKSSFELKVVPNKDCPECINFDLWEKGKILEKNIFYVGQLTTNTKGDDFALWLRGDKGDLLLRPDGLENWKSDKHGFLGPVLVGDELVSIEGGSGDTAAVKRGAKEVYQTLGIGQRADNPNKGLWAWDGHWVLEVEGKLVIDGKAMNQELGYDEIFNWRLLNGQPLFFFKKGNSYGISYAGKALEQKIDSIVHYMCCETAMFNPINYETVVQFHAARDGMWYYVELEVK
jgi:hypothetical protein